MTIETAQSSRGADTAVVIQCAGLEKSYGQRSALRGVTATVAEGERIAVFGDNGAGKSTLLRLMSGLLRPSGGRIHVFGRQPWGREGARVRARIGTLSHQSHLYQELSMRENLALYAQLNGVPDPGTRADELIERFRLAGRRADPVRTLSRGMTQRVSLMRALIHTPALLILDEPETGLDAAARDLLTRYIAERGADVTVVLATHSIDLGVALTTRDIVLRNGAIEYDSASHGVSSLSSERRREQVAEQIAPRATLT